MEERLEVTKVLVDSWRYVGMVATTALVTATAVAVGPARSVAIVRMVVASRGHCGLL